MGKQVVKKSALRKEQWLNLLSELTQQVSEWAEAQNWSIYRDKKEIQEDSFGTYEAPVLRMRMPQGEVWLDPVGHDILGGGDGRVDLEAWPSLHRVKLIRTGETWKIITDSGVPLNEPWSEQTFLRLARDLTTAR